MLSSHFLFFSGAEEGEDTAIASLASIGTAQPKLQSIPEGRTPVTPHKRRGEERGEGEMEEEVGRPDGQSMRGCERREEAIYTGANTSSQIYRAPAYFIIFFRV